MTERYLEDFAVGQTFGSGRLRVEKERIKTFAAEFDPQPFHLDEEAARGSLFRGLAASGCRFPSAISSCRAARSLGQFPELPDRQSGGFDVRLEARAQFQSPRPSLTREQFVQFAERPVACCRDTGLLFLFLPLRLDGRKGVGHFGGCTLRSHPAVLINATP